MTTATMVGSYTAFSSDLSGEELNVFRSAMKGLVGVKYTPIAVSTQLVNGMNYRFFCNAMGAYPGATNEGAMVEIYKPISDDAHIVSIHRC